MSTSSGDSDIGSDLNGAGSHEDATEEGDEDIISHKDTVSVEGRGSDKAEPDSDIVTRNCS
jgi:hypothetical protein